MKLVVLFVLVFVTFSDYVCAQKVKIKEDIAYADGEAYVQWRKVRGANAISVFELGSDREVVFLRWMDYPDPSQVSNANPKGLVRWVELKFLTLDLICEVDSRGQKGLIRFFVENALFQNGVLDEAAAKLLVKKFGVNFSSNRPESVIIINN